MESGGRADMEVVVAMGTPRDLFGSGALSGLVVGVAPGVVYIACLLVMVIGALLTGTADPGPMMDRFLRRGLGFVVDYFTDGLPVVLCLSFLGGCCALASRFSVRSGLLFRLETAGIDDVFGLDVPCAVTAIGIAIPLFTDLGGVLLVYAVCWGGLLFWGIWRLIHWPLVHYRFEGDRRWMAGYLIGVALKENQALGRSDVSVGLDGDGIVAIAGSVPDESLIPLLRSTALRVQGVIRVDTGGIAVRDIG